MLRVLTISLSVGAIAADGLPAVIAVTDDAPASDQHAAKVMLSYLMQACPDQNFTLGPPKDRAVSQFIIGSGAALALGLPPATLMGLGNESYYTGFFTPPLAASVVLTGGVGGTRGTLYAVYRSLVEVFGFDFLAHDETIVPPVCPGYLPHYELTGGPAFEYRDNNQFQPTKQPDWSTSVGYNGHGDAAHGGGVKYASPPGFVHTSYNLLSFPEASGNTPPPALYAAHPEWFWPRGAEGATAYGQLCWSNASLVSYVTAQARQILRAQPDADILSISQNDNGEQCQDPAELAINEREGSPIGALLIAVNTIAAALEADFPHVAFDTLAYQWTRAAPTSGLQPRPNVIIRLCTIECDFARPLTHANNAPFQKDILHWAKLSNRTYIWNYITNFRHYVAPFPNWHVLVPNIQFFASHGVKGVFEEGTYSTSGGDLVQLKDYLLAKALWDPTADADDLMDTFLTNYYGAAGPFVRQYMDAMVAGVETSAYYMHESFDVDAPFLTADNLLQAAGAFANASQAVTGAGAPLVGRVEEAAMPVMYVVLFRWDEIRAHAKSTSMAWPYNATKRPQFEEFRRRYEALGMRQLDEAGHDIDWMEAQLGLANGLAWSPVGTVAAARHQGSTRVSSMHWKQPVA